MDRDFEASNNTRGLGLWMNKNPNSDEVYNTIIKLNKKSLFSGILNCLVSIDNLKLPYSSPMFWGGCF